MGLLLELNDVQRNSHGHQKIAHILGDSRAAQNDSRIVPPSVGTHGVYRAPVGIIADDAGL